MWGRQGCGPGLVGSKDTGCIEGEVAPGPEQATLRGKGHAGATSEHSPGMPPAAGPMFFLRITRIRLAGCQADATSNHLTCTPPPLLTVLPLLPLLLTLLVDGNKSTMLWATTRPSVLIWHPLPCLCWLACPGQRALCGRPSRRRRERVHQGHQHAPEQPCVLQQQVGDTGVYCVGECVVSHFTAWAAVASV